MAMERTKYVHKNRTDVNEPKLLWDAIIRFTQIDRFHEKIVHHEKSVLFGYVDLTVVVECIGGVLLPIKLRGIIVKSLKGKFHLDMPAEKGADGVFYAAFMPRSSALRTVLTTFCGKDTEILATIDTAAEEAAAGVGTGLSTSNSGTDDSLDSETPAGEPTLGADNPFEDGAPSA